MESDRQLRSAGLHLKNRLRPRKVSKVTAKVVRKAVAQKTAQKSQKTTPRTGDASSASQAAVTGAPTTSAVLPVASRSPLENEHPPTLAPPVTHATSTPTSTSTSSHHLRSSNRNRGQRRQQPTWSVGQCVQVQDHRGKWYPAKIQEIKGRKLLVHFHRWSAKFDEWFDQNSDLIRMITEPTQSEEVVKNFQVDEEVLAKWTDSKFYPATIIEIQNDFCEVLFEDGYQKKVKLSALKKIPADYERAQLPSDSEEEQSEYFSVNPSNLSTFACNICSKVFRKERFLLQHIKNYHSKEEKKSERQPSSSSHHRGQRKQQGQRNAVSSTTASTSTLAISKLGSSTKTGQSEPVRPPSINPYFYYPEPPSPPYMEMNDPRRLLQDTVLPFNPEDARKIADMHEDDENIPDVVRCLCSIKQSSGLMVQCELCLTWQHGRCMGYARAEVVPAKSYFCKSCQNPKGVKKSQRPSYQLSHWLTTGLEPVFKPEYFVPHTKVHRRNQSHKHQIPNLPANQLQQQGQEQVEEEKAKENARLDVATSMIRAATQEILRCHHSITVLINEKRRNSDGEPMLTEEEVIMGDPEIQMRKADLETRLAFLLLKQDEVDARRAALYAEDTQSSGSTMTATSPENFGAFHILEEEEKNEAFCSTMKNCTILSPKTTTAVVIDSTASKAGTSSELPMQKPSQDPPNPGKSIAVLTKTFSAKEIHPHSLPDQGMEVPPSSSQSGGLFITPAQYNFMTAERELLRQQGCFSEDQHPSTSPTYEHLPVNISDGQLKLQIYNLKKDLQAVRELVNNMKVARKRR